MIHKKIALITWASSGLGKEFSYIHAEKWWDLILVARRKDKLEEIKTDLEQKYNITVYIIDKDLTADNAGQELYNEVKQLQLDIDYLINNAGFGGMWNFHERDLDKDLEMIQLNITVLTQLTGLFIKDFVKKDSGKILNVSSTASLIPGPLQAVYYATKAFVTSFSNALHQELKGTQVTVTALLPWATATEFWAKSGMDKTSIFDKTANARDVALDWYNGMLKNKINVISGLRVSQKILLFISTLLPTKMVLKIVYDMQKFK